MLLPTPLDTMPTTMVPTPTPMEPDTLARGLQMPSLRLMLLSSMETMDTLATPDMLDMLPPTPLDTLPTTMVPILTPMEPDTLARGLLMLSLRLMPLFSTATLDTLDTRELLDMLPPTPLDTLPTTMVPTLTPMEPDILARGLLMLSLRLMPLLSTATSDTPELLDILTPLDTLPTTMVPTLTPMVPDILARGLLMLSLRLMLLSSMETMDTLDILDMLLPTPLDTLDTVPMVPTPTPMELTPTLDKQLKNSLRRASIYKESNLKGESKHMKVILEIFFTTSDQGSSATHQCVGNYCENIHCFLI